MSEFVNQREQLLFRIQIGAQRDRIVGDPAVDRLGQGAVQQAGAAALRVRLQGLNVFEYRSHHSTSLERGIP
jgi:hypothetical protein